MRFPLVLLFVLNAYSGQCQYLQDQGCDDCGTDEEIGEICLTCNNETQLDSGYCYCKFANGKFNPQTSKCDSCEGIYYFENGECKCPERGQTSTVCKCPSYSTVVGDVCRCKTGYYYDQSICKSCKKRVLNCIECVEDGDIHECTKCDKYYDLSQTGDCVFTCNVKNCLECANGIETCSSCKSGFIYNESTNTCDCISPLVDKNGVCQQCSKHFSNCLDGECTNTSCAQCDANKHFEVGINGNCICEKGYGNDAMKNCKECRYSCDNCTERFDICTGSCRGNTTIENNCKCQFGYYLKNDNCYECSLLFPHCTECSLEMCGSCEKNHIWNGEECISCSEFVEGCETCSGSICSSCSDGYFKFNNTCKHCPANCLTCNEESCGSCEDRFYLNEGGCSACLNNCKICKNNSSCDECDENYEWNLTLSQCNQKENETNNESSYSDDFGKGGSKIVGIVVMFALIFSLM